MFAELRSVLVACSVSSFLLMGCASTEPTEEEDENVIAPAGKEDNYFSNTAQEYKASATVTITLGDEYKSRSESKRLARARKIMEGKTKQISWFLHVYLIDKSHDDDAGDYGGLRAMVLDGSYESDALKADQDDPLKFSYSYAVQVGGSKQLWSKIRSDLNLSSSSGTFPLKMAKLSNSKVVSFSH